MKVAVLVSGGVDSSVALRLLQQQGHELTAFYLKIWLEDELNYLGECPWEEDLAHVRAVCEQAKVPLEVISLQKEYHDEVVRYTIAEVKAGRTPNPDMLCNKRIKFGMFFKAIDDSFEKIATGHYAHVFERDGRFCIQRAPDAIKDQSYFLSQLSQEQLKRILFPLGHLQKHEVRELAQQFDLCNKDRKDSQGICFLGKLTFKDFIKHYLGERRGDMLEYETGKQLGTHDGTWFYTIGQRQGFGLAGGPWYLVAKDTEKNYLYLSRHYYAPDKQRDTFTIEQCNWISYVPTDGHVQVKMRHGPQVYDATIVFERESIVKAEAFKPECVAEAVEKGEREERVVRDRVRIRLAQRDQGIAAGQFAVLYDDNGVCLGGGVIRQEL